MNQLSKETLGLFATDKAQRFEFANDIVNRVIIGEVDSINIHLQLKAMEEIIKTIQGNEVYKRILLDESEKYGKSFDKYNAKFSIKETGVKYDYSQCNDSILLELMDKQELLDNEIKERQAFLKTVPIQGLDIIDFNGEVLKVFPPSKLSTTSVTVTLK